MKEFPEIGYTPVNLKHLREINHLTQDDVAKILGVARRTVQQWEASIDKNTAATMPHKKWIFLLNSVKNA